MSMNRKLEFRLLDSPTFDVNDDSMTVEGYVNKTDTLSEELGFIDTFREKISKGAFQRAISRAEEEGRDIDFLAEHNPNMILSSTRNSSLELIEDDIGLFMRATIVNTSWGEDFYELIKSDILRNMSFGFYPVKEEWESKGGNLIRTIKELDLFEVSVVRNPAYSASSISARGLDVVNSDDIIIPKELRNDTEDDVEDVEDEDEEDNQDALIELKDEIVKMMSKLEKMETVTLEVSNTNLDIKETLDTILEKGSLEEPTNDEGAEDDTDKNDSDDVVDGDDGDRSLEDDSVEKRDGENDDAETPEKNADKDDIENVEDEDDENTDENDLDDEDIKDDEDLEDEKIGDDTLDEQQIRSVEQTYEDIINQLR